MLYAVGWVLLPKRLRAIELLFVGFWMDFLGLLADVFLCCGVKNIFFALIYSIICNLYTENLKLKINSEECKKNNPAA